MISQLEMSTEVDLDKAAEVCIKKEAEVDTTEESCNQAEVSLPEESCSETPTDEYHYLKNGEFTSENFKVIVKNIPSRISYGCFRTNIQAFLGFKPRKVKYNNKQSYAFLAFSNEEERAKAMSILDNHVWKKCKLQCKIAGPMRDPFVRERKRKLDSQEDPEQVVDQDVLKPPEDRIVDAVCPYASKPYKEQLLLKEQHVRSCLQRLTNSMIHERVGTDWISREKGKLCLDLLPVIKSPILNNYRNKVEFTIGMGVDGKGNTVGFRLGSYREGSMLIVEPSKCINCSLKSLEVGKEFQEFIRSLPHSSYNPSTHKGFWQQLQVRTCRTDDVMVIIQVQPSHLSKEEFHDVQNKILDFFTSSSRSVKVTSVYLSSSSQSNNNIDTFKHLTGDQFINERLLGLQFRISPDAFFQVNTDAAEVLYRTIGDLCNTKQEDTCILDVCCGTGTIGLCLANGASCEVIGIEISKQAVEDAQHNAEFNGIKNASFVCGPAENVIGSTVKKIKAKNIIAVVDPPRAGLRRNVIETIRACSAINKLLYVSCSPNQAANNLVSFCRPESKRFQGTPFKTVRAVPVDLFPHTHHCELIIELVRIDYVENSICSVVNGETSLVETSITHKENSSVAPVPVPIKQEGTGDEQLVESLTPVQVPIKQEGMDAE